MRLVAALVSLLLCAACQTPGNTAPGLPQGDAESGAVLFAESIKGAPSCASCHKLTEEAAAGPGFASYGNVAAARVDGQSAFDYTYFSIVQPARHIVPGYSNLMYGSYRSRLSQQQLADLIAYLLSL